MKIVVLADIHANLEALNAVRSDIESERTHMKLDRLPIVIAGDLVDYGPNPNEVIYQLFKMDLLRDKDNKFIGTLGNHDEVVITQDYSRFRTEHGKSSAKWTNSVLTTHHRNLLNSKLFNNVFEDVLICHGDDIDKWHNVFPTDTDTLDKMIDRNPDINTFIVAHSHLQFMTTYRNKLFINPGSVGQSRNSDPAAHYAIYDTFTHTVKFRQLYYDKFPTIMKIREIPELDNFLGSRLMLGI